MFTSLVLFTLAGSTPGAEESLSWMKDYHAARKECASQNKPLAVFLGTGKNGPDKVVRDGLTDSNRQLLARYIPVYIDTTTEQGRELAQQFEMPGGQGIIISNRTGDLQAFRHEGELSSSDLTSRLERYADSGHVVSTTDTLGDVRSSFYGPTGDTVGRTSFYGPGVPTTLQGIYPAIQGYPAGGWGGGYWGGGYGGGYGGCGGGGCGGGGCGGGGCGGGRHHRR
jgi:hypothetical protein